MFSYMQRIQNLELSITHQTAIEKHDRISLIVGHFYIIKIIILKNRNNLWRSDIFLDQIEEEIKLTDFKGRLFNALF